jgi:hypothetical protein
MIQSTLEMIRRELNDKLMAEDPRREDAVILSNIVDLNGAPLANAQDKVVMCLANIQHEQGVSAWLSDPAVVSDRAGVVPPPLYIDLYVLFYANFSGQNYPGGLGMISRTIAFFQQNPVFTHDNLPGLDPKIDKLRFEFTGLDLASLDCLLRIMGANYLPSAYYRVSMIPFYDGNG